MAIGITRLTGTATGVDATSVTRSVTTAPATLYIATLGAEQGSSTNPSTPTVTHNSITATEIKSLLYVTTGTTRYKMWLFAWDSGAGSGGGPLTLTADYGTTHIGFEINVWEITGSDLSHGLVQTFVQSPTTTADSTGTSGSITLSAGSHTDNRPFAMWAHLANEEHTIGGGWSAGINVGHANPSAALKEGYRTDAFDTAASASWTTSSNYGGIAVEIKSDTAGGGATSIDPFGMAGFFGA